MVLIVGEYGKKFMGFWGRFLCQITGSKGLMVVRRRTSCVLSGPFEENALCISCCCWHTR